MKNVICSNHSILYMYFIIECFGHICQQIKKKIPFCLYFFLSFSQIFAHVFVLQFVHEKEIVAEDDQVFLMKQQVIFCP